MSENPLGLVQYKFGGGKEKPIQEATSLEIQTEVQRMLSEPETQRAMYCVAMVMELLHRRDFPEPLKVVQPLVEPINSPTKWNSSIPGKGV